MEILLERLNIGDAENLFNFESENKDFFEKSVPSRGDDYYNYGVFLDRLNSLLDEQTKGISYYYLIKDTKGSILGRINVVDIEQSKGHGYLGYRVGQSNNGKGVASKALKLLKEIILDEGIANQLSAKTTINNLGSQKVLEKNGFNLVNKNDESTVMINGQSFNFIHYYWEVHN
ncbi:GNAT family N-acetyltransferase [Rummeliibacillus pycnus]|uniref:GNAT family N-acetyltransferase n=1 Tax=Rummeliibacillus pycnus TaxID=101070 RepID=UPI0037C77BEB